jgi:His-Xaa-Ser system protein HxsD
LYVRRRRALRCPRGRDQAARPALEFAVSPGSGAIGTGDGGIMLAFAQATVDLDALQRSAYAVAAEATVDIRVSDADYVCTLFPRRGETDAEELRHRFRAEVNDQILRARIAKETDPLRNLVFALAFSRTGLVEDGETW